MSLLARARLSELIVESAQRGVALLVAPAGYGKSEAVRAAYPNAVVVLLGPHSRAVETTAKALIAAVVPRQLRGLASLLQRPEGDPEARRHLGSWVAAKLRLVQRPIVIEDFHHAGDLPEVCAFFRQVIEATTPGVKWIVVSREQPDLPVTRWIAQGWASLPLSELELQFSDEEVLQLATAAGLELDVETARAIRADTRGWPIATRLALSSWDRTRALPPLRLRTRAMLHDYIESEIWSHVGPSDRHFLQAVALLPEARTSILSEAGFPAAESTLARLHRRIPLVQLVDAATFRLHDLFREFVLAEARRDEPRFRATIAAVANALERRDRIVEALHLYVAVEDDAQIVRLLEQAGFDLLDAGERPAVTSAIGALHRETRDSPIVFALRGQLHAMDSQFAAAEICFNRATAAFKDGNLQLSTAMRLSSVLIRQYRAAAAIEVLRPELEKNRGAPLSLQMEAKATLASALAISGASNTARALISEVELALPVLSAEEKARIEYTLAYACFHVLELGKAQRFAEESATIAADISLDRLAARAYSILISISDRLAISIEAAVHYAREMERSAARANDRRLRGHALNCLYIAAVAQDRDDTITSIEKELVKIGPLKSFQDFVPTNVARAMREVSLSRFESAIEILSSVTAMTKAESAWIEALRRLLLLSSGRALPTLSPVAAHKDRESAIDAYSREYWYYAEMYNALSEWINGRTTIARKVLSTGEEELFASDRTLFRAIRSICALPRNGVQQRQVDSHLKSLIKNGTPGLARFLKAILERSLSFGEDTGGSASCTLTKTEFEVLRLLPSSLTYQQIATVRGVSPNTIKVQVSSIRTKLKADSRHMVIAIARDRGYLRDAQVETLYKPTKR